MEGELTARQQRRLWRHVVVDTSALGAAGRLAEPEGSTGVAVRVPVVGFGPAIAKEWTSR